MFISYLYILLQDMRDFQISLCGKKGLLRGNESRTYLSTRELHNAIALIHDSRHVGFQIVMQISHVLSWGANIGIKGNCGKSFRRNIELTLLKVHFRI